jgi:hypothetical protein
MKDKSFYCQREIEQGRKYSCSDQCQHCSVYYKPIEQFNFEDYKRLEVAFEDLLEQHSKYMAHPVLWKKFFKDKHNLNKHI